MFGLDSPPTSIRTHIRRNTIYQILGKVISAGLTLWATLFLAREFGAAGYGDLVKVLTFVGFFFLFADFGLNAIFLQQDRVETTKLFSRRFAALLGVRLIGGAVLMTMAGIGSLFLPSGIGSGYTQAVRLGILVYLPVILFQASITSANAIFQKQLRYDLSARSVAVGSVLTLFLLLSMPAGGSAPLVGAMVFLIGSAATAATALWLVHRQNPLSFSFGWSDVKKLLIPSIPLGITLMCNVVYSHADSVILTLTRSTTEVGTYGLAYRLFETLLVLPTFYMNAVYPFLLKEKQFSDRFMRLIRKSLRYLFFGSLIISAAVWILAPMAVYIRPEFVGSVEYLRILSISLPLFFISSLVMWVLIALGKQWTLARIYFVGMMVNIACNIWLIPVYGASAAAWITLASEAGILIVSGLSLLRYIQLQRI